MKRRVVTVDGSFCAEMLLRSRGIKERLDRFRSNPGRIRLKPVSSAPSTHPSILELNVFGSRILGHFPFHWLRLFISSLSWGSDQKVQKVAEGEKQSFFAQINYIVHPIFHRFFWTMGILALLL